MKLQIQTRSLSVPPETLARIEERVRLSLGLHTREFVGVAIQLSPARPGGVRCAVRLRSRRGDSLAIEETGPEVTGAAELALWRLDHRLKRRALTGDSRRPDRRYSSRNPS